MTDISLIYIFMNVKNLKEMFERQGTVKTGPQPKPIEKRPSPIVNSVQTPEIDIAITSHSKTSEPQRSSVIPNKNFLEELNSKIGRKSELPSKMIVYKKAETNKLGGEEYSVKEETKNQEIELRMEDILNGYELNRGRDSKMKIRYGINQKDANKSVSNIFDNESIEKSQQDLVKEDTSFFQTLQKMLTTLNEIKEPAISHQSIETTRKSKIINKYDYDNLYDNKQSKLKRVDFVINVIFGSTQYQSVSPEEAKERTMKSKTMIEQQQKEIQNKNNAISVRHTFGTQMVKKPEVKKQIQIEDIIHSKNKQTDKKVEEQEQNKRVMTFNRPNMVSNQFLAELSLKIKNKQQSEVRKTKIQAKMSQTISAQPKEENRQRSLTPRQNKKPKNKTKFDDN